MLFALKAMVWETLKKRDSEQLVEFSAAELSRSIFGLEKGQLFRK